MSTISISVFVGSLSNNDIDGVCEKFRALTLSSFPGENIAAFSLAALKLLKVMNTSYAMDIKTGSKLLQKIQNTLKKYLQKSTKISENY